MLPEDFQKKLKQHYLLSFPGILDDLETRALQFEKKPQRETYFSIYRQVHSLKGSGGTYGFPIVSTVCHQFEDYLSQFEQQDETIAPSLSDQIFNYIDLLKSTYERMTAGAEDFTDIEDLLDELKKPLIHNKLHGLFVDSSKYNGKMIGETLEQQNVTISQAYDGIEALQRLLHERFDFLITSKEIPTLNGIALIAAAKLGSKHNRNIPCVLITSDREFNDIHDLPTDKIIKKDKDFINELCAFVKTLNKS